MKLLVISRAPWTNDSGIGSTFSDFFSEFEEADIYSLCMREAPRVSPISKKNFYFSEQQFLKKLLRKGTVGKCTSEMTMSLESKKMAAMRKNLKKIDSMVPYYARELLWDLNLWKNEKFDLFLQEVDPDVVFFPDFPCWYAHKVFDYVMRKTRAKGILYHVDDCYTLRQFYLSPLYWGYRLILRKWVRNSVALSDIHYTISDVQKRDYDAAFGLEHKVLTKFADFEKEPPIKDEFNSPLKIVYTGNISINRWKSLKIIAQGLERINKYGTRAQLLIYTGTNITRKIDAALNIPKTSVIMGSIDANEIQAIQEDADILVHVESFNLKHRLLVRQSFSTKIVDYLRRGRAILAVGPENVASVQHLIENNCVVYARNVQEVEEKIRSLLENTDKLIELSKNAYECGRSKHNKKDMQAMLYADILKLASQRE